MCLLVKKYTFRYGISSKIDIILHLKNNKEYDK